MNVNDAKISKVAGDPMRMIFDRQKELMVKYLEIEKKSGVGKALLPAVHHIDDPRFQHVCKDFAWRITEELVECLDAWTEGDQTHQQEEAADALHFLVELLILNCIEPGDLRARRSIKNLDLLKGMCRLETNDQPVGEFVRIISCLGQGMNCLKNKPWKQTHMQTDAIRYKGHLMDAMFAWVRFAKSIGMTENDIFDLYFRKSEVNQFRQRSNY